MMDLFFPKELQCDNDIFWYEAYKAFEALQPQVNQSAFVPYRDTPRNEFGAENSGNMKNCVNMKKRMVEFLRRSWHPRNEIQEYEKERGFRHMMNERMRRERQKQNYMTLHSMLPFGTKSDKNSIIQTAATKIQVLQKCREELQRRNSEAEKNLAAVEGERVGRAKIKLKVANPTSGVDSVVEGLKCLKHLGLKARTIRSNFTAQEFSAELEIETEVALSLMLLFFMGQNDIEDQVTKICCFSNQF
uniref:BHLH domain-containing protein n=1 Tax=Quercus lobata TaxID=97700 RepID=A0A7N2LXB8_QUELO